MLQRSTNFVAQQTPVVPSNGLLFPWLSQEAVGYDEYKWKYVRFTYVTSDATTSIGNVLLAMEYDCTEGPPTDQLTMMNYEGAKLCSPWDTTTLVMKKSLLPYKFYFTSDLIVGTKAAGSDRTICPGQFTYATNNMNSSTGSCGIIRVSYGIELVASQIPIAPQTQRTLRLYSTSTVSNSDISGAMVQGQTAFGVFGNFVVNGSSNIVLPIYRSGRYVLSYMITTVGGTGSPFTVNVTTVGTGTATAVTSQSVWQSGAAALEYVVDLAGLAGYSTVNYVNLNLNWTNTITSGSAFHITIVGLNSGSSAEAKWSYPHPFWTFDPPKILAKSQVEEDLQRQMDILEAKNSWLMQELGRQTFVNTPDEYVRVRGSTPRPASIRDNL